MKLVYGVGINDAGYVTQKYSDSVRIMGKKIPKQVWICPYYLRWRNMLKRVFDKNYHAISPIYKDCSISGDWLYFSNFKRWVDGQPNSDWKNCQLDKDLIYTGNRVYSAETCVFLTRQVNMFLHDRKGARGKYFIGVTKRFCGKFRAHCRDPFKSGSKNLGDFPTELEAHKAWQAKKHEYACQLAELQEDSRVADALRQRYAPDKDWTKA